MNCNSLFQVIPYPLQTRFIHFLFTTFYFRFPLFPLKHFNLYHLYQTLSHWATVPYLEEENLRPSITDWRFLRMVQRFYTEWCWSANEEHPALRRHFALSLFADISTWASWMVQHVECCLRFPSITISTLSPKQTETFSFCLLGLLRSSCFRFLVWSFEESKKKRNRWWPWTLNEGFAYFRDSGKIEIIGFEIHRKNLIKSFFFLIIFI